MEFMIEAKDLTFEYPVYDENGSETGTVRAVDQMNILVQKGEFVAVLGHNGSGKSTFARHINALFLPTSGTILVDGMDTKDDTCLLYTSRHRRGLPVRGQNTKNNARTRKGPKRTVANKKK